MKEALKRFKKLLGLLETLLQFVESMSRFPAALIFSRRSLVTSSHSNKISFQSCVMYSINFLRLLCSTE